MSYESTRGANAAGTFAPRRAPTGRAEGRPQSMVDMPPRGWAPSRSSDDEIEYRPEQWSMALKMTTGRRGGWNLAYVEYAGEANYESVFGWKPTRKGAVRELFRSMRELNRRARDADGGKPSLHWLSESEDRLPLRPPID